MNVLLDSDREKVVREKIDTGPESLKAGRIVDADKAFERIEKQIAAHPCFF